MPRTIRNYAIDYNNNKTIELKNIEDLFCFCCKLFKKNRMEKKPAVFYKIELKEIIPKKYLNSSAKNIKNKKI